MCLLNTHTSLILLVKITKNVVRGARIQGHDFSLYIKQMKVQEPEII